MYAGARFRREVMFAGFMAALFTVFFHGVIELPYLVGIFSTEVTAQEVHFQLPPSPEAQGLIFT